MEPAPNPGQLPFGKQANEYVYETYPQQHQQHQPPPQYHLTKSKIYGSIRGLIRMFGAFLIGCGLGIAHHFYYSHLDGKVATFQSWYLAGGNAISYVARIAFAASIGLCIRQWFWKAMRAHPWTLGTIDKLHSVKDDPVALLSPIFALTFIVRAPVGFLITLFVWTLPLVPIIAPTSISVRTVFQTLAGTPIQIANLDWTPSTNAGRRNYQSQLATIAPYGASQGSYASPTSRALGLVYNTFNGGQILNLPSPCQGNCTFNQTFFGPTYKCEEVTLQNEDPGDPFCYNTPLADCNYKKSGSLSYPYITSWYLNSVSTCSGTGVDQSRCSNSSLTEQTIGNATFTGDGKLWIYYRWLPLEYRDPNRTTYDGSIWEDHKLVCQSYNASFTIQRAYRGVSEQSVSGSVEYLNPVNYSRDHISHPTPGELAAYSVHDILYSLIGGSIAAFGGNGPPQVIDSTQLAGSKLVEPIPFPKPLLEASDTSGTGWDAGFGIQKPVRDLARVIEELHFNVTVGMLSIQSLAWLKNETVSSTRFISENQWTYDWKILAAVYGAFVVANLLALAVGLYSIMKNNATFIQEDGFLRTMMTTRNPELDQLTEQVSDGRGDDDEQQLLERQEVRFGYLAQDPQERYHRRKVGFGLPESVVAFGK
ncbi:hypothetical protein H072_7330 [Dactylellina haptotyla CBS 200.50]|uniref:Uncharacterized protein n=1 Tax=Dactylellina haptotyla (strain CBS 200.50) TaxID=1284197 RepID=S8BI29_DACHA|nr:hypothetical protein H072_7330 [Dactylellina haptotyla CBS 200.50]